MHCRKVISFSFHDQTDMIKGSDRVVKTTLLIAAVVDEKWIFVLLHMPITG